VTRGLVWLSYVYFVGLTIELTGRGDIIQLRFNKLSEKEAIRAPVLRFVGHRLIEIIFSDGGTQRNVTSAKTRSRQSAFRQARLNRQVKTTVLVLLRSPPRTELSHWFS